MTEYDDGFNAGVDWVYSRLVRLHSEAVESRRRGGARIGVYDVMSDIREAPRPKARKKRKDPKKSRAMREAQSRARLKSGKFRKGWNKSKLMKEYHRILKRLK